LWGIVNWAGEQLDIGNYSVSYRFDCVQYSFSWHLTGVYALHSRYEKNDCWEEIAAMRGICGGHWVTCGDFTTRLMVERRGCNRITNTMTDFSKLIEGMELHDPHLNGGRLLGSEDQIIIALLDWIDFYTLVE